MFQAAGTVAVTQSVELFDVRRRSILATASHYLWTVAFLYVGVLGYLVRDWRQLQLALSLTSLVGLASIV